tara:strand:+ start:20759 stop:21154 length:396 start_codon:yes stop_codon:yes gene_type:complete
MSVSYQSAYKLIKKVVTSMPIDVFDDDTGEVWESCNYELFTPRPEGDYEGSREIGAANLISAYNLLHQKMLISELSKEDFDETVEDRSMELFKDVMEQLEEEKIVRKTPTSIRQTFKVITNETNGRRAEGA